MYKIIKSDKDTYITDRVIEGERVYNSNVGIAGSIDLFKLYGATLNGSTPNVELSRALIHFDISEIKELFSSGKLDPSHPSFFARLQMTDVYGGQPTPDKFTLVVSPLSKSFEEGHGKDVSLYTDLDISNFLTSSFNDEKWIGVGCSESGSLGTICDYFTGSFESSQYFKTGEEDLDVDVTATISGTLAGVIPDNGFRVSFSQLEENNLRTYFVKRFASRQAYDESKHPRLVIGFDDSLQDTTQGMTFDSTATTFLFNYDRGEPTNLRTPAGEITGSNCIALTLKLPRSGGISEFIFTGSQHYVGNLPATGIYSASIFLPSNNPHISAALSVSGSVNFTPVWTSLNGSSVFLTGSKLTVHPPKRGGNYLSPKKFIVSAYGLNDVHSTTESVNVKVNIFDYSSPLIKTVKLPVDSPGTLQGIVSDAFYSIREISSQKTIVPFDPEKGSTRISSDATTMFFKFDMSNLTPERSYVVDVMLKVGGEKQVYRDASPVFKVINSK
jgi:hypothetical protein